MFFSCLGYAIPDTDIPDGGPLDADGGPGDGTEQEFVDFNFRQVSLELFLGGALEAAEDVEELDGGVLEYEVGRRSDAVAARGGQDVQLL